jgi:hypothetical protein
LSKPKTIVGNLSGGICSWAACKLAVADCGPENLTLLFADTIVEDDDLYRFLVESAANVLNVQCPAKFLPGLPLIPPLNDMPARKEHLARLRREAMEAVPGLVWLADGRTPWEVYRDERFIGNDLVDPCSKILKRQLLDRWMNENFGDARPTTPRVVGLGEWERHRFEGQYVTKKGRKEWKPGLAERMAAKGWAFRAPLIYARPTLSRTDILNWLDREGIAPPPIIGRRLRDEQLRRVLLQDGTQASGQALPPPARAVRVERRAGAAEPGADRHRLHHAAA